MEQSTDSIIDYAIIPVPDSLKSDYVKTQLFKQGQIQDFQTEMIHSIHIDGLQANLQTSVLVYKFGAVTIALLCIIIFLQILILRKKG